MTEAAPVLILTGPPGAGKTTIARMLAKAGPGKIAHLHTDDFYSAIRSGFIDPWLPESHEQNLTVSRVIAAAAVAYASGGYQVIVDGIVGPWFLDVYRDEAGSRRVAIDFAVLRPQREAAIKRARERADNPLTTYPPGVFEAFSDLGSLEGHVVNVGEESAQVLVDRLTAGLTGGIFRLDP